MRFMAKIKVGPAKSMSTGEPHYSWYIGLSYPKVDAMHDGRRLSSATNLSRTFADHLALSPRPSQNLVLCTTPRRGISVSCVVASISRTVCIYAGTHGTYSDRVHLVITERLQLIIHWSQFRHKDQRPQGTESISHHARISDHLQTRGRARLDYALERNGVP